MSVAKLHKDEVVIDDLFLAAYLVYNGLSVMKCSQSYSRVAWTFLCPACDFDIMRTEFESDDRDLYVKPFVSAIKTAQSFQVLARQNCGEFVSEEWRRVIRGD